MVKKYFSNSSEKERVYILKTLLIDDLRNFVDNRKATIARNSNQALHILENDNVWDEIWLDHDLGEVDGSLDSIMPVVDFMAEAAFNDTPINVGIIYIHTSNPVGAKQMFASLTRYGYHCVKVNASDFFIV